MMIESSGRRVIAQTDLTVARALRERGAVLLAAAALSSACPANITLAEPPPNSATSMEERVKALIPDLEAHIQRGMKVFNNPGLAVGIVSGDRLVYGKGFGVRSKSGAPVDLKTVFQIGSATKPFLATTMAIAVDRGKLKWDDRVVDRDPDFQLKDPWVTHEFRVFDLMAQRSGLPSYTNDVLALLGVEPIAMMRSLRYVEPTSSFRSTFTYTNITHLIAGKVVATSQGLTDWNAVLARDLLGPLGMTDSSYTAEAIQAAANHAEGHLWTLDGPVEVPFTPLVPYNFGGAGEINSTIEDLAAVVRLHLASGEFDGKRIVSAENLAVTRIPRVGLSDTMAYAMGWLIQTTPKGQIVWHDGGTMGFGAYIGMSRDNDLGVIVLANTTNVGLPDAIGEWILDRLMGNPDIDHVAAKLAAAQAAEAARSALFTKPPKPRPTPPLTPFVGTFVNPIFGKATVAETDAALSVTFADTGSKLKFEPWDGDVFTVSLVPKGRIAAVAANLGPQPVGFAQFQIDPKGKLNLLRLSIEDYRVANQSYLFERE
jgi:CubicO group peptidase (beta-lactamase class C family)